jgi:hypothetical protein
MDQEQRSGFWSSLPGVLTGSAALITAATGGYLAFDRTSDQASAANHPQAEASAEPKPAAASSSQPAAPLAPTPAVATDAAPAAPSSSDVPAAVVDSGGAAPSVVTGEAHPSFDCARASTAVENMLCGDAQLADRDRRASQQYFALRGSLPPSVRSQLLQSQRLFLRQRSDCRSSQCLADLYDVRLRQLAEFASN